MTISLSNPEALPKVDFFRQVATATGSKLVFMAGQVAWDAGGTFDDVAKLTTYIVDWKLDKAPMLKEARDRAAAKLGVTMLAPGTLVGVASLYTPDILVEVEAIAVID